MSDALLGQANALLQSGRRPEALSCYEIYLKGHPESAEAWHNLGVTLSQMGRYQRAIPAFDKALSLRPDSAHTWSTRGNAHIELRRFEEAIRDFDRALALYPDFPTTRGYRLLAKLSCCDWAGLADEKRKIAAAVKAGARVIQPFGNLMISDDPAEQMQCARIWNARQPALAPLWKGERYEHDKLRIAYLSGDFRVHPVAILIAGVLEHHDRNRFHIVAVSYGPDDKSAMRRRISSGADEFLDVRGNTDGEVADLLYSKKIDIAVDLMGLTGDCRNGILARRPAPVQLNHLGFPGTTAMAQIDYLIADRTVIPDHERQHYSEQVVYLPNCYLPSDSKRSVAAQTPSRSQAGLPETGFVFAAFNNSYKFNPETFTVWMRILAAVSGSVLWLSQPGASAIRNLQCEARNRGLDPGRIVFAPFLESNEDHLARNSLADLFLDTLPCNAHTTASDALWAGLPVLTLEGTTFAGRVAASMLRAVGLEELIAHSVADFESLAIGYARDADVLKLIKQKLRQNRNTHPLFDTRAYTAGLERAFERMVERQRRGLRPEAFAVEAPR